MHSGHCKALAPEYEQAATILAGSNNEIALAKIDCTEENDLCSDHDIQGFPTLKVFRGSAENVSPYLGARKADAIVSYMNKMSLPAVSTIDKTSLENFKTSDDVVVVGFFADNDANKTFTAVADVLRESFLFGATSDPALAEAEGVTVPAVVMYKNYDDAKTIYTGSSFTTDELLKFVKLESVPLVGEVGPSTFSGYMQSGLPLAYIFIDNDEHKSKFVEILLPFARKYKGKMNIATIDAVKYGQHANNVNLEQQWPAFAIQDIESNLKYIYDQASEITAEGLEAFIEAFHAGSLSAKIKSQEAPEVQEGPVVIVTANTYDELVLDEDKDVLIEFYATWCSHCKRLAPIYEELGEIFWSDEDLKTKVTIAKVDTPENDVPDEVRGFPTIKLYPAGDKSNPIEYEGDRTLQSLNDFIRDNGKYHIDGLAAMKSKFVKEEKIEEHDEL